MSLLEVDAVNCYYGPVHALRDVSVRVEAGEAVAVLGGNASGKSTTIKTVLGLVHPTTGEVRFDGKRIDTLGTTAIVELGLGSIPEGRRVFAAMNVEENILMGAYPRRRAAMSQLRSEMEAIWETFPRLHERRTQLAGTLSGGEQQMLVLARAWMRKPRLLCIDEPSMGLSPLFVDVVYDVLAKWKAAGLSILLVEQQADRALELADRAYILRSGEIVLSGNARELASDPSVQRAYLGE